VAHGFDYDLAIIGAGVGGHEAALHAVKQGLKTAIIEAKDMGGTCVNRGCVPSKALLAATGRVRELNDRQHLQSLGIQLGSVSFDRQAIADHANQLATQVSGDMTKSLQRLGVDIIRGWGQLAAPQQVRVIAEGGEQSLTARDIMLCPGSSPAVPPGIQLDGKTVFTSDDALKLSWIPDWIAIIGSGYIGLEFADIYSALGSEITMVEALDRLMPGFDRDIAKFAQRSLIAPRDIETRTGTLAQRIQPGSPVAIELADASTRAVTETLEVDAALVATGRAPATKNLGLDAVGAAVDKRGFIPVDDRMAVLAEGEPVPHLWAVGDATGQLMLAHAASAQGIVAVENLCDRPQQIDYRAIPAAAFTHPEISYVGLTEADARELAAAEGFEVGTVRSYFKANTKALAEGETDGLAKAIYRKDTGEILGAHIMGLHASDLIHEVASAIAERQSVRDLAFHVHTHPTLSEVLEEAFKRAELTPAAR